MPHLPFSGKSVGRKDQCSGAGSCHDWIACSLCRSGWLLRGGTVAWSWVDLTAVSTKCSIRCINII